MPSHDDREALAVSGSAIESSLWSRLRPMFVSPANRTRALSSGNEVLTADRF